MRRAWTGSREPKDRPFSRDEVIHIALDVASVVRKSDAIGVGGCNGVDEIVLQTALRLRSTLFLHIIVFTADGERSWPDTCAEPFMINLADTVLTKGWKYLERDCKLVDWAESVRAIPLTPFRRLPTGLIAPERGSGTNYTAREAEQQGKLEEVIPLRRR